MKMSLLPVCCLSLVLLAPAGCSDPAENVPAAKVSAPEASPAPPEPAAEVYTVADESTLEFIGSKITGSHDGGFNEFEGEIRLVDGDPAQSSVRLMIDTTSLWADDERLTGHLKSPDFFDVATYPQASFTSTTIIPAESGYLVTGNLDLHGVTKSISFPATIEVLPGQVTARAEFSIKRFDFGIEYKGKADDLIRDDVVVKFDLIARPASS